MSISGVLTTVGRVAGAKGFVGVVGGINIKNVLKYFVFGEGGFQLTPVVGETIATGNGLQLVFSTSSAQTPIQRGTLFVTAGAVIASDNGQGVLSGAGVSGTVNYKTGAISLTYLSAPAVGPITATYQYRSAPATPLASRITTVAQQSPTDPTDVNHLAWFRKDFGEDVTTVVEYIDTPSPRARATLFLDLAEFIDDGRGESPVLFEVGVFDTEDQMVAYGTFTKELKNGSSTVTHTCTFVW